LWQEGSQEVQLSQTVEEGKKEKKEKKNDCKRKKKLQVKLDDSDVSSSESGE
jgi:hypothetical protein